MEAWPPLPPLTGTLKILIYIIHEVRLHDQKVGVWCAVIARRVIGPIFFYDTVNSQRYVHDILQPFFAILTED